MKVYRVWEETSNKYVNYHNHIYEYIPAKFNNLIRSYSKELALAIIKQLKIADNFVIEAYKLSLTNKPQLYRHYHRHYILQEVSVDQIHLTDHELSEIIKGALEYGENPVFNIEKARMAKVQTDDSGTFPFMLKDSHI